MNSRTLLFSAHANSDIEFSSQSEFEEYLFQALLLEPNGVSLPDNFLFSPHANAYSKQHLKSDGGSWLDAAFRHKFDDIPISLILRPGSRPSTTAIARYYREQARIGHYGSSSDPLPTLVKRFNETDLTPFCFQPDVRSGSILSRLEKLFSIERSKLIERLQEQAGLFTETDSIRSWLDHWELFFHSWQTAKQTLDRYSDDLGFHDVSVSDMFRIVATRDGVRTDDAPLLAGFSKIIGDKWTGEKKAAVTSFIQTLVYWYGLRDAHQCGTGLSYKPASSVAEFLTKNVISQSAHQESHYETSRCFEIKLPRASLLAKTTGDYFVIVRSSAQFHEYRAAYNYWHTLPTEASPTKVDEAMRILEAKTIKYLDFCVSKLSSRFMSSENVVYTGGVLVLRNLTSERVAAIFASVLGFQISARIYGSDVKKSAKEQSQSMFMRLLDTPWIANTFNLARSQIDKKILDTVSVAMNRDQPIKFLAARANMLK